MLRHAQSHTTHDCVGTNGVMVANGDLKSAILYVSFVDTGKNEFFSPSRVSAMLGSCLS